MPSEWWAATVIATDESMRVSSSIAIAYESVSLPAPSYSSGIVIPISPSSASSATSSYGNRFSRSSSSATGAILLERELPDGVAEELVLRLKVEVHSGARCYRGAACDRLEFMRREASTDDRGVDRGDRPHRLRAADAALGGRRCGGARGEPPPARRGPGPICSSCDRAVPADGATCLSYGFRPQQAVNPSKGATVAAKEFFDKPPERAPTRRSSQA